MCSAAERPGKGLLPGKNDPVTVWRAAAPPARSVLAAGGRSRWPEARPGRRAELEAKARASVRRGRRTGLARTISTRPRAAHDRRSAVDARAAAAEAERRGVVVNKGRHWKVASSELVYAGCCAWVHGRHAASVGARRRRAATSRAVVVAGAEGARVGVLVSFVGAVHAASASQGHRRRPTLRLPPPGSRRPVSGAVTGGPRSTLPARPRPSTTPPSHSAGRARR